MFPEQSEQPMIPTDLSRVSRVRKGLAFAASCVLFLTVASCQTADSSSVTNPTQVKANINLNDEWKAPDAVTWRVSVEAKPAQLSGSGKSFVATIDLATALKAGDSIIVQMWTAGMRTAEIKYLQVAGSPVLEMNGNARLDPVALALLERIPAANQRNIDTLLAVYAKALVDAGPSDSVFKGFPTNCPTGIDTSALIKIAMAYALGKGSKLAALSATWLLAIDTATVHARVRALVVAGAAKTSDTLGMFPPPPIRLMVPISVASSVQAGGNAVAVSGAFEWDKGLGLVAVNSYVIQGADTLKTVSVNGIPAIGSGELAMSLTGNAQIMAGSAAPVGICSLVVVVRDGNGNAVRSATSLEILKGVVVPQTPTIRLLSPVDGKVVPFDTASILVKWIATALNSKIDTVQIGDQMGAQENDSVWSARVPLPATGKPTVVTARAHSIQNVWAVQSASFTRSMDQAGPTLTWVSPLADTIAESSTTSLVIRFKVQDPSGVDTILVNGQSPDSVSNAGVVWKTVALGATGGVTPVSVRVVDGAKNATVSVRSVTRKTDNSLVIYGLPDSVRVLEDSSTTLSLQPNCPSGSVCKLKVTNSDTTLLVASLSGDTALRIAPKGDRNGIATVSVSITSGSITTVHPVVVEIEPVNDAPTFSVISALRGVPSGVSIFSNWLVSVSPGPADESTQRIAYQVAVDLGASLVTGTPFVDATGKLTLTGKGISGVARLAVVAVDNGDSTGSNRNHSAAQYIRVRLDAPPTLEVADTLVGYEDQRTKSDTIRLDDLESSDGLTLDWTVLDSTILPKANLRVKAVPGGYSFDALTAKDSSGNVRIAWTLTDPVGSVVRDTSVIRFIPINDAPMIGKAPGLPDTLVISCLTRDTTLPKLFGDIQWEPGMSNQTGTFKIVLADTAQASLFYIASGANGIQPTSDGRLRIEVNADTDVVVGVQVIVEDNGGVVNGGINIGKRSIWLHLTNTVKDADGNAYAFRHMPDGKVWLQSNLFTKPKNGDTVYRCAGENLWGPAYAHLTADCTKRGALYNWGTAMNQALGCDTSATCYQTIPTQVQGLCPKGWHVAERSDWSQLMFVTADRQVGNYTVDSTKHLRSATHDWGTVYSGWSEFPGTGKYGDFLVPTDNPHSCADKGASSTNGANFWLPHRPASFANPMPGGINLVLGMASVSSWGMCGSTDPGLGSIRCVLDSP